MCCFYKNSLTRTASFILHIKPSHIFMVSKSWFRNGHCNYITPDRQPQGRLSAWGGPQMDTLVWCVVSQAPLPGSRGLWAYHEVHSRPKLELCLQVHVSCFSRKDKLKVSQNKVIVIKKFKGLREGDSPLFHRTSFCHSAF